MRTGATPGSWPIRRDVVWDDGRVASDPVEFRTSGRLLTTAVAVVCAVGLVLTAMDDLATAVRWAPLLGLVVLLTWAVLVRPAVIVHDGGVDLRNVLRTVHLPWPAVVRVDTRYALTLVTRDRSYSAWAAPAPSRAQTLRSSPADLEHLASSATIGGAVRPGDLLSSASGQAAELIRRRWQSLADDGAFSGPAVELATPQVRWHTGVGVAVLTLAALAVLGLTV